MIRDDLCPHLAGVVLHPHHEIRPHDGGITRPVFNIRCDGQLSARLDALHQNRLEHSTAGVNRRRIARRARANNQKTGMAGCTHEMDPSLNLSRAAIAAWAMTPERHSAAHILILI